MSYDGEICNGCGLPVALGMGSYWLASDDLWEEVVSTIWMAPDDFRSVVLCPRCFFVAAEKIGVPIHWEAVRGV